MSEDIRQVIQRAKRTGKLISDIGGGANIPFQQASYVTNDLLNSMRDVQLLDYKMSQDYVDDRLAQANNVFMKYIGQQPFSLDKKNNIKVKDGLRKMEVYPEDPPEQKSFKYIFNKMVEWGGVPHPNYWKEAVTKSMTNGMWKMFAGKDLWSDLGYIDVNRKGFVYDGKQLELSETEQELLDSFYNRAIGNEKERGFWGDVLMEMGALTVDLPMMMATNFLASGAVGLGARAIGAIGARRATAQVLSRAGAGKRLQSIMRGTNAGWQKTFESVAQQAVNFNLMGIPQTLKSEDPASEILHNVWIGAMAGTFPRVGMLGARQIQEKTTKEILRRYPAMLQEMSGLTSSFTFGTASALATGESGLDAIARGLAFAGTHFTNPKSYVRAIKEIRKRPVAMYVPSRGEMEGKPMRDWYFEVDQKNNKAYPIDAERYHKEGEIKRIDTDAIPLNKEGFKDRLRYTHEVEATATRKFREAMTLYDTKELKRTLIERWKKNFGEKEFERNRDQLAVVADWTARQLMVVGEAEATAFKQSKTAFDFELRKEVVDATNKEGISIGRLETYLLENAADYVSNLGATEKYKPVGEYDKAYTDRLQNLAENIKDSEARKATERRLFGEREPIRDIEETPPFDAVKHMQDFSGKVSKATTVDELRKAYEDYYSPFTLYGAESLQRAATQKTQKIQAKERKVEVPESKQEYMAKNFRFTGDANKDMEQWNQLEQKYRRVSGEQAKEVEARVPERIRQQNQRLEELRETIRQRRGEITKEPTAERRPTEVTPEGEAVEVTRDPQSRAIVNEVERQFQKLKEMGEPMDERVITDKINQIRDPRELDRLEQIYTEALEYNRQFREERSGERRPEEPELLEVPREPVEPRRPEITPEEARRPETPREPERPREPEIPRETPEQIRDREISEKIEDIGRKRSEEIFGERKVTEETARERIQEIENLQRRMRERGGEGDRESIELLEKFKGEYREIIERKPGERLQVSPENTRAVKRMIRADKSDQTIKTALKIGDKELAEHKRRMREGEVAQAENVNRSMETARITGEEARRSEEINIVRDVTKDVVDHLSRLPSREYRNKVVRAFKDKEARKELEAPEREMIERYTKLMDNMPEKAQVDMPRAERVLALATHPRNELTKEQVEQRYANDPVAGKTLNKVRRVIEKNAGTKNQWTKTFKDLGIPKNWKFLAEALDAMGTGIRFERKTAPRITRKYPDVLAYFSGGDNIIGFNGNFIGKSANAKEARRKRRMTSDELLKMNIVHEAIHALDTNFGAVFKEKYIIPQYDKIATQLRKSFNEDSRLLEKDSYAQSRIRMIFEQQNPEDGFYELATQAFSDPAVARYLDAVPASPSYRRETIRTIWDQIVDLLSTGYERVMNLKEGSAFEELRDNLSNVFNKTGISEVGTPKIRGEKFRAKRQDIARVEELPGIEQIKPTETETGVSYPNLGGKTRLKLNADRFVSTEHKNAVERRYGKLFARKIPADFLGEKIKYVERIASDPDYYKKTEKVEIPKTAEEIQKVEDYAKINERMLHDDKMRAEKTGLVDKVDGEKVWNRMLRTMASDNLKNGFTKYLELNTPPIFKAEMSKRFREQVYEEGETMIRMVPEFTNKVLWQRDGWNNGNTWRKLAGLKVFSGIKGKKDFQDITPEAKGLLEAIRTYEHGRYTGQIKRELGWEEFKDWAGLTEKQRQVIDGMQRAQTEAINMMKGMKVKYIMDLDNNVVDSIGLKRIRKMAGKDTKRSKLIKEIVNKIDAMEGLKEGQRKDMLNISVQQNPELKRAIAEEIVDAQYRGWGKRFHYNGMRPSDPNVYLLDAVIPDANMPKGEYRTFTYFETAQELKDARARLKKEGWTINEDRQIKDIIKSGEHFNKLTAHQLMELAEAGHVNMDSQVFQKLYEATKRGVDLHTIHKEYIPGMKYDAKEFEMQLNRFVRSAINSSVKQYYMTKIDRNLRKWSGDLNAMKTEEQRIKGDFTKQKGEFEYSEKYFNQLKQAERTVIDHLRGATITFQVGGIKPAFLFQQMHQVTQTTFAQTVADMKQHLNLGSIEATKVFGRAMQKAFGAQIELHRRKKGLDNKYSKVKNTPIDKGLVDVLEVLEQMGKIQPAGLTELTAQTGETHFAYSTGMSKMMQGLQRAGTLAGKAVEKMTRTQSAAVFYEIGKRRGLEGRDLINYMADGVDKTMAEWGKGGRAPLLDPKGNLPSKSPLANAMKKSFMTYKTFSFYNYGLWKNLIQKRQYSALMAKALVGLGMHGITKFPLMATTWMLADMFTDEEMDYKMWEWADTVDETVGKVDLPLGLDVGLGQFLHRGVYSGLGLDLRETFGEETPLVTDLWAESWANTWESKLTDITLGAPFGFSKDQLRGYEEFVNVLAKEIDSKEFWTNKEKERSMKIIKKMPPIFLRNIINAFDFAKDGIEYRDKKYVFADDLTPLDLALKAMSFPLAKRTRIFDEYRGGAEAQMREANELLRKAKKHRDEMRLEGVPVDVISREMKRIAEAMNEARETIRKLKPEVRRIERERKLNQ